MGKKNAILIGFIYVSRHVLFHLFRQDYCIAWSVSQPHPEDFLSPQQLERLFNIGNETRWKVLIIEGDENYARPYIDRLRDDTDFIAVTNPDANVLRSLGCEILDESWHPGMPPMWNEDNFVPYLSQRYGVPLQKFEFPVQLFNPERLKEIAEEIER
jgi:hypothetical protein